MSGRAAFGPLVTLRADGQSGPRAVYPWADPRESPACCDSVGAQLIQLHGILVQIIQPVEKIADFRTLGEGEILCGYLDGMSGSPVRCRKSYTLTDIVGEPELSTVALLNMTMRSSGLKAQSNNLSM